MPHSDLAFVRRSLTETPSDDDELVSKLLTVKAKIAARNARLERPLSRHDVDDVAQEVVRVVWEKRADYAGEGAFEAWLYAFCVLGLKSFGRLCRRSVASTSLDLEERACVESDDDFLERERLHALLDELDRSTRRIVVQKHFEGRTFAEIAVSMVTSENTIKTKYYRGIARLRALLTATGEP